VDKPGKRVQNNINMVRLSPLASLFEAGSGNEENTFRGMETYEEGLLLDSLF
jgi:hypothetical protein